MKIFYFTSTGNCLEVAKNFTNTPISIPSALKNNQLDFEDDIIGIITPNYQGDLPEPVKEFMQKVTLKASYIFGIVTYGAFNANANEVFFNIGKQNGIHFNYLNSIIMVDNSIVYFDMDQQIKDLPKKKVDESILKIKSEIDQKTQKIYGINLVNKAIGSLVKLRRVNTDYAQNFTIENSCIKCGICKKVCPIDNIIMADKPTFSDNCIRCGACTHNCPHNAIRYKGEKSKSRYRNTKVTLAEIIAANN